MMQIQKHCGPDDEDVFLENNVSLGFGRLSILDLLPSGHQPMVSKDEIFVLIFNGEIYCYIELREDLEKDGCVFYTQTDSEVLLNAYIKF